MIPEQGLEIFKSFVPGKGWASASQLPKKDLKAAAGKGMFNNKSHRVQARGLKRPGWQNPAYAKFRGEAAERKRNITLASTHGFEYPSRRGHRIIDTSVLPAGIGGEAYKFGGRKSKGVLLTGASADEGTITHELAHLDPKRSGYRVHEQIASDPQRRLREEARADMAAGRHYKSDNRSGYGEAANAPFRSKAAPDYLTQGAVGEYKRIQDKISTARKFKRDQNGRFA